jgi:hypothetical protein
MGLTRVQVHQLDVIGAGTSGLVLPAGNTAQRPPFANVGALRFNTDILELEEFNGLVWSTVSDETHLLFTGDVSGMGNVGTITTLTLSSVNSNVGTFGSNVAIPVLTVNDKGLITAISTTSIDGNIGTSPISQAQILTITSLRI